MNIRQATPADSKRISELVSGLAEKYIAHEFTQAGAETLLRSMQPDAVEKCIQAGYEYHVAEMDGRLVGVVAVRDNSHLYHLFVDEAHQKQGIATALWRVALESCLSKGNPGTFTVNSSRHARTVYEKLGFRAQSAAREKRGVVSIPMKLTIRPRR